MEPNTVLFCSLSSANWGNDVPSIDESDDEATDNLKKLDKIVSLVSKEIRSTSTIRNDAQVIIQKCWNFAKNCPNAPLALKACQICQDRLANLKVDDEKFVDPNVKIITFDLKGDKFALPAYYKDILAKQSIYFETMFQGAFKEGRAERTQISLGGSIDNKIFTLMIDHLKGPLPDLKNMSVEELWDLYGKIEPFCIRSLNDNIAENIADKLQFLAHTENDMGLAISARTINPLSTHSKSKLDDAFDDYFANIIFTYKKIGDVINFLKTEVVGEDGKTYTLGRTDKMSWSI